MPTRSSATFKTTKLVASRWTLSVSSMSQISSTWREQAMRIVLMKCSTTYASMQSDGQQAADFIEVLYPTLKEAGLSTKIACCDGSGWEQQRVRLQGIQAAGEESALGLVTSHGYSSFPSTPFATDLKTWQTEWSTFDPINYAWYVNGAQSEGLTWANRIHDLFAVSNVTGHLYWWGMLCLFLVSLLRVEYCGTLAVETTPPEPSSILFHVFLTQTTC